MAPHNSQPVRKKLVAMKSLGIYPFNPYATALTRQEYWTVGKEMATEPVYSSRAPKIQREQPSLPANRASSNPALKGSLVDCIEFPDLQIGRASCRER